MWRSIRLSEVMLTSQSTPHVVSNVPRSARHYGRWPGFHDDSNIVALTNVDRLESSVVLVYYPLKLIARFDQRE